MERFELDPKLKGELRARVLGEGFMKLVQTVRRNGKTFKIAMRPVAIGGERKFQAEMTEDGRVQVRNLDTVAAAEGLEEIIAQRGARDLHLMTASGDLHMRVTKKGRVLVSRSAAMDRVAEVKPHDRVKKLPLTSFDSTSLLKVIGIADGEGKIRASMRGKYDQVNEFLKVVKETLTKDGSPDVPGLAPSEGRPFTVVDCGCGKAYLTICLWYYLTAVLKYPHVKVIGIDRRNDVITAARKMADQLDLGDRVVFVESGLEDFNGAAHRESDARHPAPGAPFLADMVVSLHACDTATDEALAKGVEWKARYILSAPCCQHELQKHVGAFGGKAGLPSAPFAGLLRQSILRERLCDLLTDAYRALILRILGFKVQVIEFVSSEATARNLMLRCEYAVKPGQTGPVNEYLALRDFWGVTPWLETRLRQPLERYFGRFE
ncbi:MAG: class I SAM-dependent methyltransferase [Kiritimatiellia bacterium]